MRISTLTATRPASGKTAGYTLIEMAIVVSVAGLLLSSFITAYNVYKKTRVQITTENNASLVVTELKNYLAQNGHYPCPARTDVGRLDPGYGMPSECDPAVGAYPTADATAGNCASGLCFEVTTTFIDKDPSPSNICDRLLGPNDPGRCEFAKVRRGAIPFRALGLPENQAEDGYGNKFIYAVTENLAVATSYVRKSGAITVQDGAETNVPPEPPNNLVPIDNLAHYILISPGMDQAGAYTREGKLIAACPAVGLDRENCQTDGTGTNSQPIYKAAGYSRAEGPAHFDDYVKFYTSIETPLWQVSGGGFHIRDLIEAENLGQIGINNTSPATNAKVDVAGEIKADGSLNATQVCGLDPSNPNCLPVSDFAQESHSFKCPTGTYARAFGAPTASGTASPIEGNALYDVNAKYIKCVPTSGDGCAAGEYMTGIEFTADAPQGKVKCTSIVACPARTDTLCSSTPAQQTFTIPSKTQGQPAVSPTVGVSRVRNYICEKNAAGNPVLRTVSTTGVCTCNAVDEYYDTTCNVWKGYGNWTGVVTQHHVHTCPDDGDSTTVSSDTCLCSPLTQTAPAACPIGQVGGIINERNWICDTPTSGHWTGWSVQSNTCTCVASTQNDVQSCPPGFSGAIARHQDTTCPGPVVGPWVEDSNTCTCVAQPDDFRSLPCPPNQTGTITENRQWICSGASGSWGSWLPFSNTCACTLGQTESRTQSCPGPYDTGQISEERAYNCGTSSWSDWYQVNNTCTCVEVDDTRTIPCTAPLIGTITQTRTYNCATNSWPTDWTNLVDSCGTVAYSWVPKTTATGPFGSPLSIQSNSSCSTAGSNSSCSSPAGGGQYWHYAQCQCE